MIVEETQNGLKIDKSSWSKVKLGDVVREVRETVKNPEIEGIERVVGLEHLESESIHIKKWGLLSEGTTFTKQFRKGQVLFGRRRAYLKKAALATFSGLCSGDITVLEAKKGLLPGLLPFIIQNDKFFDLAVKNSAGSLSPRVKFKDLVDEEVLLPPKDQQGLFAELLWALDGVIEKHHKLRNHLFTTKNIVLNSLFNLNWSETNNFFKNIDIADFRRVKFADVCLESMFGPRFSSKLYNPNGNVASLRTTDLDDSGHISLNTMPMAQLPDEKFIEHYLQIGDLVISRSGTCGIAAVFEGFSCPVLPAAFLIRFRLSNEVNPYYLRLYFNSKAGRAETTKVSTGAVQKNLTSKALLGLKIPIPSREIQDKIIKQVEDLDPTIIRNHITSSKELQKSVINQIF